MKRITRHLTRIMTMLALVLACSLAPATPALAACSADSASAKAVLQGVNDTGDCDTSGRGLDNVVELVINILSVITGIIAVIMIIVGGLKYITSSGDSGNVTSAKNTILYAIIGLVVVALAQIIVRFILGKV